jgi:hypothetical protein
MLNEFLVQRLYDLISGLYKKINEHGVQKLLFLNHIFSTKVKVVVLAQFKSNLPLCYVVCDNLLRKKMILKNFADFGDRIPPKGILDLVIFWYHKTSPPASSP